MPIYEYECTKCGHRSEKIQKISARRVGKCPECKGRTERMVNAPAIQFKGSGWYVTDYAGKGQEPKGEKTDGASGSDSGKGDAKKSSDSSKSDTKKSSDSGKSDAKKSSKSSD